MTTEQLNLELSSISDNDLANLATDYILDLCKTGCKSFTMSVPVRSKDTDIIFCELISRFKKLTSTKNH